jgi:hypothetical protein
VVCEGFGVCIGASSSRCRQIRCQGTAGATGGQQGSGNRGGLGFVGFGVVVCEGFAEWGSLMRVTALRVMYTSVVQTGADVRVAADSTARTTK